MPVYNQKRLVAESLRRTKATIEKNFELFEIVIVNDGSSDNTLEILEQEGRKDRRVRVVSYTPNTGKGYAERKT
jgi:glycosyltransferase involved in cell wall biosynthesis